LTGDPADLTNPNGNAVNVGSSGIVNGGIYGGLAESFSGDDVTANDNKVSISGGSTVSIKGGHADSYGGDGTASGNSVDIGGGSTVSGRVDGGHVEIDNGEATASGNSVSISGGSTVSGRISGGRVENYIGTAVASGNFVHIDDSTVSDVVGGSVDSDGSDATANENTVNISGASTVSGFASGGEAYIVNGEAVASGNTLNIGGDSHVSSVYGGYANVNGTGTGAAYGNTVNIGDDSMISSVVTGGYVDGNGNATNNIVTVSGNANLTTATLLGGRVTGTGDFFTGNTLNLKGWTGTVAEVGNFETWNIALPSTFAAGQTALTVTGTVDIQGSTLNVGIDGNTSALNKDDTFTLIDAGALVADANTTIKGMQGLTLDYDFDAEIVGSKFVTKVTNIGVNPQTKALAEGFLGGVAFARQGADWSPVRG
jgi:hypothetical protein